MIGIFLLLSLIALGLFIVANYYGDEIKKLVVENLNKNLRTEVEVKQVDFSVWESFPLASVVFTDVVMHAVDAKNDTLLSAEKLSAQFNLMDIFNEQYNLIGLQLSNGVCRMLVDDDGRENYIFWTEKDSSSASFSTELERVALKNMSYQYIDYRKDINISFLIEKANVKGKFSNAIFDLELESDLQAANIQLGELELIRNRNLRLNSISKVDQKKQQITFSETDLVIDGMDLLINGNYAFGDRSSIDLSIASNNAALEKSIALLPQSIRKKLSKYAIKGEAMFSGNVSGSLNQPSYEFGFSIKNARLNDKENELIYSNVNIEGKVLNGAKNQLSTSQLQLNKFSAHIGEGTIEGKMQLSNFKKPQYTYEGKLAFDLEEAKKLFKWNQLEQAAGLVEVDLSVQGQLQEAGKYSIKDWKSSKIDGHAKVRELEFKIKGQPQAYSAISADLDFNNNSIDVENLKAIIDNTQIRLNGKFNNLIGFLMVKEEPLFIDAVLKSPRVDLADLLNSSSTPADTEKNYELDFSPNLTVYLDAEIDTLTFNQFELTRLNSFFVLREERIDARTIRFNSQGGEFEGDLFIRENDQNRLTFHSQVDLRRINIKSLFNSFDNFGQKTLQAQHISGIADATIQYSSEWTKTLEVIPSSIQLDADLVIDNGVLVDFKPLESMSKFIDLEELKRVEFKQINNQVSIRDEVIRIPKFDLYSSAMNVTVSGTHTFDNEIDYHFTLLLNELLGRKVRKPKRNEFGYVEDDGLGKTKLFLKMTGTVANPKIAYDSKELKNNLKEKLRQEKQTVKRLLKEEFGWFKKDTSLVAPKPQQKSPFQVEIDSTYLRQKGNKNGHIEQEKGEKEEKGAERKSKFGKFLDKIAKPNEEEYVEPIEN